MEAGECDWCGCLIHTNRISNWLTDDVNTLSSTFEKYKAWDFFILCGSTYCHKCKHTMDGGNDEGTEVTSEPQHCEQDWPQCRNYL